MTKEGVQALYLDLVRKEPKITLGEALMILLEAKLPPYVVSLWFAEQLNIRAEARRAENEKKD